jgi:hypothetical protein
VVYVVLAERFPFDNVMFEFLELLFFVAKLLVGVSVVWSIDVKLLTVNVFPLPELSVPKAPLSWNSKKNPLVPYVPV